MMPRPRPSARVLLLALAASVTAFFLACGIKNPYPYDYGAFIDSDSFLETLDENEQLVDTASFTHELNTKDVEIVGFNLYYYLANEKDLTPTESMYISNGLLELPNKSYKPTIEIPETSVSDMSKVYADISYFKDNNVLKFTLFKDAARENPLQFHLNDSGTTLGSEVDIPIETDNSQYLYISFQYAIISSFYDVEEQPLRRLGYVTLN